MKRALLLFLVVLLASCSVGIRDESNDDMITDKAFRIESQAYNVVVEGVDIIGHRDINTLNVIGAIDVKPSVRYAVDVYMVMERGRTTYLYNVMGEATVEQIESFEKLYEDDNILFGYDMFTGGKSLTSFSILLILIVGISIIVILASLFSRLG